MACLLAAVFLISSCNKEGGKVIPRAKLAKIYAEMLMIDQWIQNSPDIRYIADTTLVYDPILEEYGYTKLDYVHTVNVYLDDPERFSRVWRSTSEILKKRLKELKKIRGDMDEAEQRRREMQRYAVDFPVGDFFPYMEEPVVHYYDSLAVEIDSLTGHYRFYDVARSDTTYDGLVMNIRIDSLATVDSLALTDSPAVTDSLKVIDSLVVVAKDKVAAPELLKENVPVKLEEPAQIKDARFKKGAK